VCVYWNRTQFYLNSTHRICYILYCNLTQQYPINDKIVRLFLKCNVAKRTMPFNVEVYYQNAKFLCISIAMSL